MLVSFGLMMMLKVGFALSETFDRESDNGYVAVRKTEVAFLDSNVEDNLRSMNFTVVLSEPSRGFIVIYENDEPKRRRWTAQACGFHRNGDDGPKTEITQQIFVNLKDKKYYCVGFQLHTVEDKKGIANEKRYLYFGDVYRYSAADQKMVRELGPPMFNGRW